MTRPAGTAELRPVPVTHDSLPPTLAVRAWWDPQLATDGFDLRSDYVERFWLGVLGPSVTLLLRRLARGLDEHPGGFTVDVADTARAIGLSPSTSRNAPLPRTLQRACTFSAMRRVAADGYEVRTHLPRLSSRQLDRLPLAVRRSHDAWTARLAPAPMHGPPAA